MVNRLLLFVAILGLLTSCDRSGIDPATTTLAQARSGFTTDLVRKVATEEPVPEPPSDLFTLVRYPSSVGSLSAYISVPPSTSKRYPAIVWVFGGFDNSIGDTAWEPADRENDQSARAFREAGIVTMYPSFRGGNDNPGAIEAFCGEVDDLLAAADFLAKQDFVDPKRIYLGGHSTGGTLALLAAESSDRFRAVFALGPVARAVDYPREYLPFRRSKRIERDLRAPILWLHCIHTPTFVFEGADPPGNYDSLMELGGATTNPNLLVFPVDGGTHFTIIAPVTELIAGKILNDQGPQSNIEFTSDELSRAMEASE